MESSKEVNDKTHFYQTKPIAFIERYCSRLQINSELTKLASFIAKKIEKKSGRNRKSAENKNPTIFFFSKTNDKRTNKIKQFDLRTLRLFK